MPPALDLAALRDYHKGESAAILGAGPSLPLEVWKVPANARLVGVNLHAIILPLDYVAFTDDVALTETLRQLPCWKITQRHFEDEERMIWAGIAPAFGISGPFALWCCDWLGFAPIYMAGFDHYGSGKKYWHSLPRDPEVTGLSGPEVWRRCFRTLRNPAAVQFFNPTIPKLLEASDEG